MRSMLAESPSSVRLPHVFTIGFVGSALPANPAMYRARIDELLADRKSHVERLVCGIASLPFEEQPIFPESCIALGIPLRLLIPLPRERFLRECSPAFRDCFTYILDRAVSIEVAGSDASLAEGQYECSLQVVQQSQELLAIWDGKPSYGLAGTAAIVEFAGEMRRPVTWIHSATSVVQPIHPHRSDKASDHELNFLNALPNIGVSGDCQGPSALALAWLAKLDANAANVAPQVRKLAAVPIICTALAAFVSAAAQGRKLSAVWIAVGAVLGLAASLLPMALRLGTRQALWVRIRTAAEVSRSMVALWSTPARYQIVGPEILPELSGMVRSLDLLKSQARQESEITLSDFKDRYIKDRLLDQMSYFARQSAQSAATGRRYRLIGTICSIAAIVLSAWMFASHFLLKSSSATSWLGLVTPALFQVATVAGALLIVKDCDRRQRRYHELHHALADWEAELRVFRSWPPVIEVVSKIERALLVELLEWRSLLQNRKMPRN